MADDAVTPIPNPKTFEEQEADIQLYLEHLRLGWPPGGDPQMKLQLRAALKIVRRRMEAGLPPIPSDPADPFYMEGEVLEGLLQELAEQFMHLAEVSTAAHRRGREAKTAFILTTNELVYYKSRLDRTRALFLLDVAFDSGDSLGPVNPMTDPNEILRMRDVKKSADFTMQYINPGFEIEGRKMHFKHDASSGVAMGETSELLATGIGSYRTVNTYGDNKQWNAEVVLGGFVNAYWCVDNSRSLQRPGSEGGISEDYLYSSAGHGEMLTEWWPTSGVDMQGTRRTIRWRNPADRRKELGLPGYEVGFDISEIVVDMHARAELEGLVNEAQGVYDDLQQTAERRDAALKTLLDAEAAAGVPPPRLRRSLVANMALWYDYSHTAVAVLPVMLLEELDVYPKLDGAAVGRVPQWMMPDLEGRGQLLGPNEPFDGMTVVQFRQEVVTKSIRSFIGRQIESQLDEQAGKIFDFYSSDEESSQADDDGDEGFQTEEEEYEPSQE